MKKNDVIKGLMVIVLIGFVGLQSPTVLANEQREPIPSIDSSEVKESTDVSEAVVKTTTEESTIETKDAGQSTEKGTKTITEEDKETVTGTFGTVPWTLEIETETLVFGEGEFPNTDESSSIHSIIEKSLPKSIYIKKIVFTKPVIANKNSSYLFSWLYYLNSIDGEELLDTSNVTDMNNLFKSAHFLKELDLNNWDTSQVTDMSYMFREALRLRKLDVNKWDTSKVSNMAGLFLYTNYMRDIDLSNWNTSNVTNMSSMFLWSALTTLDLNQWDTRNVTNMSSMFEYARDLSTLNVSKWDTRNVTDMNEMFANASKLTTIDVGKWNTSNVTDMYRMFANASKLTTIDVSIWNTSNVTNMANMFEVASELSTLDVSKWNTGNVTRMECMFNGASSLTELDVSKWDTSNVTNMSVLFAFTNLTTIDVSKWNTTNVTNMAAMFVNTPNLTTIDVSIWNTKNVTDMRALFQGASKLTAIDVSKWDTSNVTNMETLFAATLSLTAIDVSKWNITNVTNMSYIFFNTRFTTLDLSQWDTRNVRTLSNMFSQSSIDTLILGEHTLLKNSNLPEKNDDPYTGNWTLVSPDTQNSYSSSEDFMTNYDGTKTGKYVREKVEDNTKVTGIELTPPTIELAVSEKTTVQSKIIPDTASNKKVSYTSSDNAIATVSEDGVITALKKGTAFITATTSDGGLKATSTVAIVEPSSLLIDPFYLGIDSYVTGSIDPSSSAKKVQLVVNGEVITTSMIFSDGSFELDTKGMITKVTDKVEAIALDRKNKELDRTSVTIEEKSYNLTVNPYTLYEESTVTGQTDYFHTHVALLINGEEVERKPLSSTRQFSFDVEGLIEYADDEVNIVGYRYDDEITRKEVAIQEPVIEMALSPYKVDDPYVTGKVTGKSAKNVRLYVNGRRQQTVKVAEDGTFSLLGMAILSPKDRVQVAVLNDSGIEIKRFAVTVTN
ncbi:BspA family leucine-rich repeat surface protein [Enterococcus ureasiticus]|uniref:BIG2 domain-containing protein n=1 Tax=Enterococcus ureasiticus TaxID=903984 RepID=A0A1E5GHU6_9ENTE|nr:BspA family leucine-rich repeat surface protein [Enterococcus ureasiticus]OEG11800.1 hypothetical protein BCR21_06095 [Enterococcus ureasiticus]